VLAGKCVSREMQEINREVDPFIKKNRRKHLTGTFVLISSFLRLVYDPAVTLFQCSQQFIIQGNIIIAFCSFSEFDRFVSCCDSI
jgi:hypothetical protein